MEVYKCIHIKTNGVKLDSIKYNKTLNKKKCFQSIMLSGIKWYLILNLYTENI